MPTSVHWQSISNGSLISRQSPLLHENVFHHQQASVQKAQKAGLKAKPEVGIQFGAGGAIAKGGCRARRTKDPGWTIQRALLEAGAYMIMLESKGITENVQLEALRSGISGTKSFRSRVVTYKGY